jgi:hypothetical protein
MRLEPGNTYGPIGPFQFHPDRFIKRLSYRGFLSAVWMLWKMNRAAKSNGIRTRCQIDLPIRWLR